MRKSKKILALIMTVIMSLSLISSAIVYAEPPVVTITVGTVVGTPGGQVVVPVNLSNLTVDGLVLTDIMLQYDDTKLHLDAITPAVKPAGVITTASDLSQSVIDATQGAGLFKLLYFDNAFAGTGTTHISTNGLFANLTFTVLSDGSSNIPITITADTIVGDIYENPYYIEQIGTVDGAVTFATATPEPATATPEPATATPEPATATPVPTYDITVSVDDTMGMVINTATDTVVKNGQKVTVTEGTDLKLRVVAFGGYKIDGVIYDGGAVAGSGMFKYTVNTGAITASTGLAVSFVAFTPPAPKAISFDDVIIGSDAGQPSGTSYGTVQGVTQADITSKVISCGIVLWNTGAADVTLLDAFANPNDGIHIFSATTGGSAAGVNALGQFAVMVKNLPAGTWKMKTYIVKNSHVASYGDIVTFTVA